MRKQNQAITKSISTRKPVKKTTKKSVESPKVKNSSKDKTLSQYSKTVKIIHELDAKLDRISKKKYRLPKNIIQTPEENESNKSGKVVQLFNPITKRYMMIDEVTGLVMKYKKSEGPYKNIAIIRKGE